MRTLFCLGFAIFLVGCVDAHSFDTTPDSEPGPGAPGTQIRLWAENHPVLPAYDVVLDGCRQWWPNAVDCVLTDEFDSTMRINAVTPEDTADSVDQAQVDMANCVKDAEGKVTLAISKGGGWIDIFPKCFEIKDVNGNVVGYNTLTAMSVITHEVGHELGLPHVEKVCTPNALYVPGSGALCGDAIMNPIIDPGTAAPTPVDDIAYDLFVNQVKLPPPFAACTLKMP